ncbi:MAG: sterol desaturase family protein [Alphaproteobacteria bacterium]|nr:sterol desaturase family protein [Alphaproteobacteria bacterium]MBT4017975.1 sterol desaturase family protein [Alphaproteobacteria bacterium]MBT6384890.1 sterol desaturase family protein [Alphaproteobacteria bacterium]
MFQDFADNLPVILKQLMALLLVPLRAPLDQGTLLHWPFLLSALTIALLATRFAPGALHFLKVYFSRAVWWHPSARADYLYYLINGAFFPVIFAPLLAVSAIVSSATVDMFNAPSGSGEAHWIIVTAFSLAVFVAYDFGRYIGHWVQHKNAVLWEFHKVHHSAEVLTPLTSFRLHPVDLLLMSAVPGFFTGLVGGSAIIATGGAITPWQVLGMHGGIAAYHLISNLRHTHVWVSFGPVWSRYFISPAQHQIHHSADEKHFHTNIGWAFAIWDRLFGTLYVPEGKEEITYGLGDGTDADYHGVIRMYFLPVVRAGQSCVTTCVVYFRK